MDSLFSPTDPRRPMPFLSKRYAVGGAVQKGRPWWRYLPWAPQSEEDRIASLEAYAKLEQERARKLQGLKRGGRK